MARTLQDQNFFVWEAYPSAGDHGFTSEPYIVFNCLTDPLQRPRQVQIDGDEADAEKLLTTSNDQQLLDLFSKATPLP